MDERRSGLVRIAWALLVPITGGAALLAYIVAWVVLPEAPAEDDPASQDSPSRPIDRRRTQLVLGGGLVLVGLWFLVREYLPDFDWGFVWPLVLVAGGIAILISASRRADATAHSRAGRRCLRSAISGCPQVRPMSDQATAATAARAPATSLRPEALTRSPRCPCGGSGNWKP